MWCVDGDCQRIGLKAEIASLNFTLEKRDAELVNLRAEVARLKDQRVNDGE